MSQFKEEILKFVSLMGDGETMDKLENDTRKISKNASRKVIEIITDEFEDSEYKELAEQLSILQTIKALMFCAIMKTNSEKTFDEMIELVVSNVKDAKKEHARQKKYE